MCIPETVAGIWNALMTRRDINPHPCGTYFLAGGMRELTTKMTNHIIC
jgi:hypothetical protein